MQLNPRRWRLPLQKGLSGPDVEALQTYLVLSGLDLGPYGPNQDGVDGSFGGLTANGVLAMSSRWGLAPKNYVDRTWVDAMTGMSGETEPPTLFEIDTLPFVQAKNYTQGRYGAAITHIVIHSMEAAEASTTAGAVASWFSGSNAPRASAHLCIDNKHVIQCVKFEDIAWHAPGLNSRSIGIEHAGYARQTREQWLDDFSAEMLKRSASICAQLCKRYSIPVRFVDVDGLKNEPPEPGITTHNSVSKAFGRSTHWDPGPGFPIDLYLDMVDRELRARS